MTRNTRNAITRLLYIRDDSTVAAHVRRETGLVCTSADVATVRMTKATGHVRCVETTA